MKIGDVFYVAKDEWSARGQDEKYHEYMIHGEDEKLWLARSKTGWDGAVNKRSGWFRESNFDETGYDSKTHEIFTPLEKTQAEFAVKYRSKVIVEIQRCDPETLIKVARIVGVWNEN